MEQLERVAVSGNVIAIAAAAERKELRIVVTDWMNYSDSSNNLVTLRICVLFFSPLSPRVEVSITEMLAHQLAPLESELEAEKQGDETDWHKDAEGLNVAFAGKDEYQGGGYEGED